MNKGDKMETKFYIPLYSKELGAMFTLGDVQVIAQHHFNVFYISETTQVTRVQEKGIVSGVVVITTHDQNFKTVLPFLAELKLKLGHHDVRVVVAKTIGEPCQ